jgi:methylmalonyl-CoA mutase N-terminal domain/subunit
MGKIKSLYTRKDLKGWSPDRDLGLPGQFPYTRGVYPDMYRKQLWTMRQFSGFGSAENTNKRFKYLLSHGTTGLSVAFDMPTLMGYDSDHPRSLGEVGKCGVAIDTLQDMERLFDGIKLDQVSTSMTINGPAIILFAMYVAVAEKQGVRPAALTGTLQNDILKEFIAQKEWISPPEPSLKLINDIIRFCVEKAPRFHPVSISGYHIREAGSSAVQELAFTLYDGLTYVESAIKSGLKVDQFAPRLSFFFNAHNDFFEEVAKFRAARRIWARSMKQKFRPRKPESMALRFHTQTAGCTLTAQQPVNNIVRVALQALAGVLGGTQSLHTNSMDETLALPSEEAVKIALRTQQIIALETGIPGTADPLGGSYYIETLTNQIEKEALLYFKKLDRLGGMVAAIEKGFPQREIHRSAMQIQKETDQKKINIVGMNCFVEASEPPISLLKISDRIEREQTRKLKLFKKKRNAKKAREALHRLAEGADRGDDLMPMVIGAVKAGATLGEMTELFKQIYGEYHETWSV